MADVHHHKPLLKVIMLGDVGVGKTSLINRYVHKKFVQQYKATIGADFVTKELQIDGKKSVILQIWDTAGQERYASLGTAFFRGADCCVLVFDVNSVRSFDSLQKWRHDFLKQTDIPNPDKFPFILIGNKIDEHDETSPAVTEKIVKEEWREWFGVDVHYFQASAKNNVNVNEAFHCIAKEAADAHEEVSADYFQNMPSSISGLEERRGCAC